jgi:DNA uptake protein ComE-like DNA-binding protein
MKLRMTATTAALVLALVAVGALTPTIAVAQVGKNMGVLNPNLAGKEELLALPQLDENLVEAILEQRPFLSMTALDALLSKSIDDEQRGALYAKLFIPINLNDASREEILMVPGVGARMAHEFEEYRPYRALAQFRREIGKYVDDDEVARLEQFVFVPIELNTASKEDILSIPGVGNRMLHEFEEYRPYRSMEQFRREIGKYVDDKELARLERYVTLAEP